MEEGGGGREEGKGVGERKVRKYTDREEGKEMGKEMGKEEGR